MDLNTDATKFEIRTTGEASRRDQFETISNDQNSKPNLYYFKNDYVTPFLALPP